jgi:MFS transporter, putative metabolite:H+ symporter
MAESTVPAPVRDVNAAARISARIDRIPVWPYSWTIYVIVGVGFFFSFFEIGSIGPSLPKVIEATHSSTVDGATAVSLGLWGYIAGSPLNSILSDRVGRRIALLNAMCLYGIGALGMALSTTMTEFTIARFVGGMGIGASIAVVSTYISEISPADRRGRAMALTCMPAVFAGAVTPFLGRWLVPDYTWGWRVMIVIPVIGTVLFIAGYRLLPESPRWLAATGRYDEAERVVAAAERVAVAKTGGSLPPVVVSPHREPQAISFWARMSLLLRPPHLRWTVTFFLLWICQTLPAYGISGFGVTLLTKHGFTLQHSIELTYGQAVGSVIGGLLAWRLGDRVPRKWFAAGCATLAAAGLLALGFHPANWLILVGFGLVSFQTGVCSAVVYMLTAEHFPTQIRNTGMAISDGGGHLGGAIAAWVAVTVYAAAGFAAVWTVFGLVFVLYVALVSTVRVTTARPLEEISAAPRRAAEPVITDAQEA